MRKNSQENRRSSPSVVLDDLVETPAVEGTAEYPALSKSGHSVAPWPLGAVLLILGLGIALHAVCGDSPDQREFWRTIGFAAAFGIPGAVFLAMGLRGPLMKRKRLAASEPECRDYPWNHEGFKVSGLPDAILAVCLLAGGSALVGAVQLSAELSKRPCPMYVSALFLLFQAGLVAAWLVILRNLARAARFGTSCVKFAQFPYRLGECLVVRWICPRNFGPVKAGRFCLRCVQEAEQVVRRGTETSTRLVHLPQWSGYWELPQGTHLMQDQVVRLTGAPPLSAPPTSLGGGDRIIFWEITVKLDVPGLDFHAAYLIPVY